MKKLFCLFAALTLLLCGCKSEKEYNSESTGSVPDYIINYPGTDTSSKTDDTDSEDSTASDSDADTSSKKPSSRPCDSTGSENASKPQNNSSDRQDTSSKKPTVSSKPQDTSSDESFGSSKPQDTSSKDSEVSSKPQDTSSKKPTSPKPQDTSSKKPTSSKPQDTSSKKPTSSNQQDTSSNDSDSSKPQNGSSSKPTSSKPQNDSSNNPTVSNPEGENDQQPESATGLHYYDNLNDSQKRVYTIIASAVRDMTSGMISLGSSTAMDVSLAFTAVRTDHPEYFWMPYSYINKLENNEFYIALNYSDDINTVSYLCSAEQRISMEDALTAKIKEIKALIPSGTSDYEAELILHDWLCENVEYLDMSDDTMRHTAYGAIVNGRAVCEGYARAMQLLCKELSIPCTLVCGSSAETGENHMWNKIRIGGAWYNLDVTWDDHDQYKMAAHHYFNLTDDAISKTHVADPDFSKLSSSDFGGGTVPSYNFALPRCTAVKYHYPAWNDGTLDANDDASKVIIRDMLKKAADDKKGYCEFYLPFDPGNVDPTEIAKKYSLQNCINDVNSNSNNKIIAEQTRVTLIGRTFIVFLTYGG